MTRPYTGSMSPDDIAEQLYAMAPVIHRASDPRAEALAAAISAVTWFPLKWAPRDGTRMLLVVAPSDGQGLEGFITIGRWVVPFADALQGMGRKRRKRFEASGGWWSSSRSGRPFDRPVLAWKPVPFFDFDAANRNHVETING